MTNDYKLSIWRFHKYSKVTNQTLVVATLVSKYHFRNKTKKNQTEVNSIYFCWLIHFRPARWTLPIHSQGGNLPSIAFLIYYNQHTPSLQPKFIHKKKTNIRSTSNIPLSRFTFVNVVHFTSSPWFFFFLLFCFDYFSIIIMKIKTKRL